MLLHIALACLGAAQAGDLDFGVGLREPGAALDLASQGANAFGGVQGLARYRFGWVTLEGDVYYNPFPARYSQLDAAIVQISANGDPNVGFQMPLYNETLSAQALVNVGLPHDEDARWAGGPYLVGGLWGGLVQEANLRYEPDSPDGVVAELSGRTVRLGPVAGLAMEGWYAGRVGLRLSWLARLARQARPQYNPDEPLDGYSLVNYRALTLDLMVHR